MTEGSPLPLSTSDIIHWENTSHETLKYKLQAKTAAKTMVKKANKKKDIYLSA